MKKMEGLALFLLSFFVVGETLMAACGDEVVYTYNEQYGGREADWMYVFTPGDNNGVDEDISTPRIFPAKFLVVTRELLHDARDLRKWHYKYTYVDSMDDARLLLDYSKVSEVVGVYSLGKNKVEFVEMYTTIRKMETYVLKD